MHMFFSDMYAGMVHCPTLKHTGLGDIRTNTSATVVTPQKYDSLFPIAEAEPL